MQITQEKLNSWYEHKSNKEIEMEDQDEIEEDTTSMEEKLEQLDNPYKENVEEPQRSNLNEILKN